VVIKVLRWIGWVMIALGIVLAALFVGGLTHPVSAQVPSTVASYNSHHRWVVTGFVVSMVGAAILLVAETFRRSQKTQKSKPSTTPVA
jgi:hypothetical protein